jgi:hypothetical protein
LYSYSYKRIILNKMFKKRKDNQNKVTGRKRKIFATIALSLSFTFAKPRLSFSQSSSPNFSNQEVSERLIDDREFYSLEENDRQVILAKAEGNPITPPTNRGPSNFPTPPSGGRLGRPVYVPKHRIAPKIVDPGLGAGANPAGAGGGGENPEFDDQCPVPKTQESQESKTFDYDSRSNSPKKKNKSQDQCSIDEQNKAGIDELPDSSEYIYNLETKTARKALKTVWKNTEAKKEVLAGLDKMNSGKLLPRNQKNFKGFKTLKELKFTKTRMLVQPGINGGPDQIVAIFMRRDMDNIASNFKGKYK